MVKCNNATLDDIFSALGDPTRRAILARLASGDAPVSELAEPHDMSLPAISKHLRVLEGAGLVKKHRDGRVIRCALDPEPLKSAAEWIERYRIFWEGRLDALAAYLDETRTDGADDAQEKAG